MPSLYYSDAVCSKPLFEQVKEKIIDQIRKGVWQANAMLPNELALADMYSVSQGTVRRALQALVQEGILVRHQGRGTFVASFRRNVSNVKTRINWFESDDVTLKVGQSKIVSFEKIAPLGKVLQRVGTQGFFTFAERLPGHLTGKWCALTIFIFLSVFIRASR